MDTYIQGTVVSQKVNNMRLTSNSLLLTSDNKIIKFVEEYDHEFLANDGNMYNFKDVHYIKLFVKTEKGELIELRYVDYDNVKVGDIIEGTTFMKAVKPKYGDIVAVTAIPISILKNKFSRDIDISRILKGKITGTIDNKYKIDIGTHTLLLRRNCFQLTSKNNLRKVAQYVNTIN